MQKAHSFQVHCGGTAQHGTLACLDVYKRQVIHIEAARNGQHLCRDRIGIAFVRVILSENARMRTCHPEIAVYRRYRSFVGIVGFELRKSF